MMYEFGLQMANTGSDLFGWRLEIYVLTFRFQIQFLLAIVIRNSHKAMAMCRCGMKSGK